jgi:hypothetical protein
MPDDKQNQQQARLQKRIDRLQQEWDLSDEKLRLMRRQRITETRNEEKFRLQQAIDQTQMEQDEIEQQLMDLHEQIAELDDPDSNANKSAKMDTDSVSRTVINAGTYIGGDANINGDFVGRDKIINPTYQTVQGGPDLGKIEKL